MTTLETLIAAYHAARAAWFESDTEANGDPEWDAYEAAEDTVLRYPCTTLAEVQEKARFFLDNDSPFDTLRNCQTATEEALRPFLRSLCGTP